MSRHVCQVCQVSRKVDKWDISEKSIKNVDVDFLIFAICKSFVNVRGSSSKGKNNYTVKTYFVTLICSGVYRVQKINIFSKFKMLEYLFVFIYPTQIRDSHAT